jgi:hypothetical protein
MPIRRSGRVLAVYAEVAHYVIEPIRFDLGLSRVEMIDEHLAELTRAGRGHGPDADELLDARGIFSRPEHVPAD